MTPWLAQKSAPSVPESSKTSLSCFFEQGGPDVLWKQPKQFSGPNTLTRKNWHSVDRWFVHVCPLTTPFSAVKVQMRQTYSSWGNKSYYVVCPRTRTGRKNGQCWTEGKGKVPASKLERSQSRNNDMMHLWMRFCGHHAVIMRYCSGWPASPASSPVAQARWAPERRKKARREWGKEGRKQRFC